MTAPDPAAKEKSHEPTPEPAKKKGDELTTKELDGVVGGNSCLAFNRDVVFNRDVALGVPSGKRQHKP
jgi:hypothetical protein